MGVFNLKYRDTQPVLEVALLNPDLSPADLTGSTIKLHIRLADGATRLIRDMVIQGDPLLGIVRYQWIATDWDVASGTTVDGAYPVGGLVVTPGGFVTGGFGSPITYYRLTGSDHLFECEVISGTSRGTFPNAPPTCKGGGYDILRIIPDIGQGA